MVIRWSRVVASLLAAAATGAVTGAAWGKARSNALSQRSRIAESLVLTLWGSESRYARSAEFMLNLQTPFSGFSTVAAFTEGTTNAPAPIAAAQERAAILRLLNTLDTVAHFQQMYAFHARVT